jgi:hypothetical protein
MWRGVGGHTEALVTVSSTSWFHALIRSSNLVQTPSINPSLLFSAKVFRKFLTVSCLSATPICFINSPTMAVLSEGFNVGAWSIVFSLGSFLRRPDREARDLATPSKMEVFAAAVYYPHYCI